MQALPRQPLRQLAGLLQPGLQGLQGVVSGLALGLRLGLRLRLLLALAAPLLALGLLELQLLHRLLRLGVALLRLLKLGLQARQPRLVAGLRRQRLGFAVQALHPLLPLLALLLKGALLRPQHAQRLLALGQRAAAALQPLLRRLQLGLGGGLRSGLLLALRHQISRLQDSGLLLLG